ncbi:Sds3-like-domain-containing protein [Lipomyces chichibuensis]|uniref:Sds3-like-domain-containing protein n=1 Tax=Lipomyces chichibuensis TaxID=1546026 RepID=UPI00334371D2
MDSRSEEAPILQLVEENPEEAETEIEGELEEMDMDMGHPELDGQDKKEAKGSPNHNWINEANLETVRLQPRGSKSRSLANVISEAFEAVVEKQKLLEKEIKDDRSVLKDEEDDGEVYEDEEKEEGEIDSADETPARSPVQERDESEKNEEDEDEEMKDSSKDTEEPLDSTAQEEDNDKEDEGEIDGDLEAQLVEEAEEEAEEADDAEADAEEMHSEKRKRKRVTEEDDDDEERAQKRKAAVTSLTEIEVEFAKLRDRLHDDKIARLQAEIEMCLDGTHPELATVYDELAEARDLRIKLADAHRKYRRRCIENQTRSYRTHIHQQLYKNNANLRAAMIQETTETWYKVNRERRAMDTVVPFYGYKIPEKRSVIFRQRQAQYNEIALLTGIAKYIGFPAAPEIKSATADEVAEDMEALRGKVMYI